jgi:excisionase family DNA binding protein
MEVTMKLSIREAATLLGRSPRTLRAQLARGEIPGVKKGGRWTLDRRDLPLTESQRRALQGKADSLREAVEDALPSRVADRAGKRAKSLADLEVFRLVATLLGEVRAAEVGTLQEIHPQPLL